MDARVGREMEGTTGVPVRRKGRNHDWGMCVRRAAQQVQNESQSNGRWGFLARSDQRKSAKMLLTRR